MELTLVVDHQCNLRCRYCYTGHKFDRRMPDEVMRQALDRAFDSAPSHLDIGFSGGEPLLHLEFLETAAEYAEERVAELGSRSPTLRYVVSTNLTLLGERAVAWLKRLPSEVSTSLDGPEPVHDAVRRQDDGEGSHARVRSSLNRLDAEGIPYSVNTVVTRDTASRLGEVVAELFATNARRFRLALNFLEPWAQANLRALEQGLLAAAEVWMEAFRRGEQRQLEPFHSKILSHLYGGVGCPSRCRIVGREWSVAPSGNIYPCVRMVGDDTKHELVIGNVATGVLAERVQHLQHLVDRVEETCSGCEHGGRCASHCGCQHLALTGELGRVSPVLCDSEEAVIRAANHVAETLFREACPAFMDFYYRKRWMPAQVAPPTHLRRGRE